MCEIAYLAFSKSKKDHNIENEVMNSQCQNMNYVGIMKYIIFLDVVDPLPEIVMLRDNLNCK